MACLFGHRWNGCKCERCGKIRDEQHVWAGCKCKRCGKTRDEQHDWKFCRCNRCGKKRNIDEIIEQSTLADIAEYGFDCSVRMQAVNKILDQSLLTNIAKKDPSDLPKNINVSYISLQKDNNADVSFAAVVKLTNEASFVDVAKNSKSPKVAQYAVERVTDQASLVDIAKNAYCNKHIGEYAISRVTDQVLLAEFATTKYRVGGNRLLAMQDIGLREHAISRMTDQALLTEVAMCESGSGAVRKMTINKLTDKITLTMIMNGDKTKFVYGSSSGSTFDRDMVEIDLRETARKRLAELE